MTTTTVMTIRAARADEAPALTAIALQSKSHWPYPAEQIAAWRTDLTVTAETIASAHVNVVQCEESIAGFYVLLPQTGDWVLEHMWLLPAYMGRGFGRALLEHARRTAIAGGAAAITIDADPNAEAFYAACGAKTVGKVAAPVEGMPDRIRPQMVLTVSG
jgi:GNAT superfamily N-acetyltransferase